MKRLAEQDIAKGAQVLVRSFWNDPLMVWLTPVQEVAGGFVN